MSLSLVEQVNVLGQWSIAPYRAELTAQWDQLILQSSMGTFLHTRKFLAYHGNRFEDASLVIQKNNGELVAVLPAALNPGDQSEIVSHPGITFGGLVHNGDITGESIIACFEGIRDYYRRQGFSRLIYKAVPHIYHRQPAQDDLYALFRLGAERIRCDLSCSIDLRQPFTPSTRRKRGYKKAVKLAIEIQEGLRFLPALWKVLEENLTRKHSAKPVHTLSEIQHLSDQFPDNIQCVVAVYNAEVVAGVVLFLTPQRVMHAQYIASSQAGYDISALDLVFRHCIEQGEAARYAFFDFGTSNEQAGLVLNNGLYQFKSEFGGGGIAYEYYAL